MIINLGYLYGLLWILVAFLAYGYYGAPSESIPIYVSVLLSVTGVVVGFSFSSKPRNSLLSRAAYSIRHSSSRRLIDSPIGLFLIFSIYISLFILETFSAGGLPLLGLLGIGKQVNYVDFGIPSLHGFVNSLSYASLLVAFYQIYTGSTWKTRAFHPRICIYLVTGCLILQLHRAVIMAAIIQAFALYLYFNYRRRRLRILLFFLIPVLLFGFLGDIRSGREHFLALAGLPDYPAYLPTGFAWIYLYLVTPFVNTLANANYLNYSDHTFLPFETLTSAIPSFIRPASTLTLSLNNDAWNVHSFFSPLLYDYGLWCFLPSAALGFFWGICFNSAKLYRQYSCIYSVATMQVVLTVFGSLALHISFIAELVILFVLARSRFSYHKSCITIGEVLQK